MKIHYLKKKVALFAESSSFVQKIRFWKKHKPQKLFSIGKREKNRGYLAFKLKGRITILRHVVKPESQISFVFS